MESGINITAILVANGMAMTLLLVLVFSNRWRFADIAKSNRLLRVMITLVFLCCVIDPIVFIIDGKTGSAAHVLVYVGNLWLYFTNLIIMPCWIAFVCDHVAFQQPRYQLAIVYAFNLFGLILLIGNLFSPLVFGVDANNVYFRGPFYWYFTLLEAAMLLYSIGIYILAKRKGGTLKFFPVWVFVIPVILGVAAQSAFYGISTMWPFSAISVAGVLASLQNELLFRDKLTGLFNRFYLDFLKDKGISTSTHLAAIMTDLNGFKKINDEFGHLVGDEALIEAARILKSAVGLYGSAIRYAGDEFVVLINTQDEKVIEDCVARIRQGFEDFNAVSGKPYELSISLGWCKMDLDDMDVNEILNMADSLMYEDKRAYYTVHDRRANH